jgi:D-beta-D-heptose 7-phosphate kinase/D-beta-D-heptose 1-phosphate adenosyltransferase
MQDLKKIISRFPKVRILVIGDLILDEYIWGNVERISPEAPVPVVWAQKRTHMPGGAANVAHNLCSLGAEAGLAGAIGDDKNTDLLLDGIKEKGICVKGVFQEKGRHTTLKTRIIAGHQQVVRVDWEHTHPLSAQLNRRIISFVKKNIPAFDAVIIEDYGKGVINIQLLESLIFLARENKKIITVDPKEDHFQYYRGVTSITPNRRELENAIRNLKLRDTKNLLKIGSDRLFSDKDIDFASRQILEYLELDSLLVTLGENGMKLLEAEGRLTHIPTVAQKVFDVSGAGDTVIATFTLALASGADFQQAAKLANYAAGIVVGKVGTAVTTREELADQIAKG